MTDKRFESDGWKITDNETQKDIGMIEASNLLNELLEENQLLKQKVAEQGTQIDFLKSENLDFKNKNDSLQLENETLKKQVNCIKKSLNAQLKNYGGYK